MQTSAGARRAQCRAYAAVFLPLVLAACSADALAASGDAYPSRPLRVIVPFSPGGGSDNIARLIAPRLSETVGQPVVVDNRPGANTNIGAGIVATAPPDGHTLLLANANHTINPALFRNLPFDSLNDFVPVSSLADVANVLVVNATLPAKSVRDLISLAKAKPGQLKYGSGGSGSPPHLSAEIFKSMTGTDMLHVPYKGVTPALNDTVGGHLQMTISVIPASIALVKAGKLKALGVTSAKRTPLVPDLPTIAETVPGYEFIGWYGLVAPAKTPPHIIAKLNAEVVKALKTPEFQERLSALGAEPIGTSAQELGTFTREQIAKMGKAVKQSGARPDA